MRVLTLGHALGGSLALGPLANEHVRLVLHGAGVVGVGAFDLGQQQRDVVDPGVGVRPADEGVHRSGLPVVVPGMELLEVLPTFCLGAGERDLDDVTHLGRPAAERLDELAQGQAARGLRTEFVFMDVLHGDRILAAVRCAHPWLPL